MIYLPTPFYGILLERNLTPVEACTCLRGSIMYGVQEVDFRTIIYWLLVALTKKVGDNKLPLALTRSNAPLAYGDLLLHCHHMLTRHLPRMEPYFHRVKGSLIATHIREVVLELRQDREAKAQAR